MESYLGTIQAFAFDYAPQGWASCNGQALSKDQYSALYSLIGNTYGGTANVSVGLPDLRGRTMLHQGRLSGGGTYVMGGRSGQETVTLNPTNMPEHNHSLMVTTAEATSASPGGDLVLASANGLGAIGDPLTVHVFGPAPGSTPLSPTAISVAGAAPAAVRPFSVLQPFMVVNYCINVFGGVQPHAQ